MADIKQIIEEINVTICDIETLKLENPQSQELRLAVGQAKAVRASLVAFMMSNDTVRFSEMLTRKAMEHCDSCIRVKAGKQSTCPFHPLAKKEVSK